MQENDEVRRAQLVAAAEALVSWIHTRRATWPELPAGFEAQGARLDASPGMVPLAPIAEAIRPLKPAAPPFARPKEPEIELPFEPPAPPRPRWSERLAPVWSAVVQVAGWLRQAATWIIATLILVLRRSVTPLARVSRRSAAYVATLAVLLVGGWLAHPYWPMVVARFAPRAEQSPPAEPAVAGRAPQSGQLMVRSDPAGARVTVDGKPMGVTPIDVDGLSVGRHTLVIETDQGSVRRTVAVEAGGATLVNESIYAGFLKVFAPFELQITDGVRLIRLDDQNQVMLPPGSYQLELENTTLGFRETRRVDVNPGQTSTLSIVPPPSSVTVTSNVPAVVSIDGAEVGPTPLTDHPIPLGTRDIVVRSQSGQQRRFTRRVTVAPLQLVADF